MENKPVVPTPEKNDELIKRDEDSENLVAVDRNAQDYLNPNVPVEESEKKLPEASEIGSSYAFPEDLQKAEEEKRKVYEEEKLSEEELEQKRLAETQAISAKQGATSQGLARSAINPQQTSVVHPGALQAQQEKSSESKSSKSK